MVDSASGVRTRGVRGVRFSSAVCAFAKVGVTASADVVLLVVGLDEMAVLVPACAGEGEKGER